MRLGLLTVAFADRPLEQALDDVVALGLDAVELGAGAYPGDDHCRPAELLEDPAALRRFSAAVSGRGLVISALAAHGNPLHPDPAVAAPHHDAFRRAVRLAGQLGVPRVTLFSGCPGSDAAALRPSWVTCAWPPDFAESLEWQWAERIGPYWSEQAAFAAEHGVRLCFEMHPGMAVYHPPSLLRLRALAGEAVGANLDPSHLIWQGIDVPTAIRELAAADALFHVHAKDVALDPRVVAARGVLDTTPLEHVNDRAWTFRTVGYGHGEPFWRAFFSALGTAGYDDVVSIEHEDALASRDEGVAKAVALLRACSFRDPPANPWWA